MECALAHKRAEILLHPLAMHPPVENDYGRANRTSHRMPFVILTVALQIIAVVHLFRTGRSMTWLFLIIMVPMVGCLAYFIIEVLPALNHSPTARKALRRAKQAIDPNRGVREGSLNYERSQNVDTASRLADELTKAGRHDEAIRVCNEARTGLFEDDPKILLALANAQFAAGQHSDAIATLDYLRETNPSFRSAYGHLVYARALDESGATGRALEEYSALANYFPGAEARVRQAMLYKRLGDNVRAGELFAALLKDARLAPKHFRRSEREWIELAERESATV
jgi:hypothetical protein